MKGKNKFQSEEVSHPVFVSRLVVYGFADPDAEIDPGPNPYLADRSDPDLIELKNTPKIKLLPHL